MPWAIFLDLYRVLANPGLMEQHYRRRYAEILSRDFGVPVAKGKQIHDETYAWYTAEGARLDSLQGDMRDGEEWVRAVQRMETDHLRMAFEMAGLTPPPNLNSYWMKLETEIVSGIDALYSDVKPALSELKADGHRIFLSTNATRSNGEFALVGGGIKEMFEGLVFMENAKAKKDRPHYWRRAFGLTKIKPAEAVVVDDIPAYLAPVSTMGARCFQMIRPEHAGVEKGRWPIISSLAELPAALRKL
jgi:HAD superfamily hydrolase (TIGR01509 family)